MSALAQANSQLAACEALIQRFVAGNATVEQLQQAAAIFLEWLQGARVEQAKEIHDAVTCSCGSPLVCRACSWGC